MKEKMTRAETSAIKKEHIYNVAMRLFTELGYDNVTTKMISRESGISEGSIYNFFGEKAGILSLLTEQLQKYIYPLIEPTEENLKNPVKALENYMYAQTETYVALKEDILKVYLYNIEKFIPSVPNHNPDFYSIVHTIEPDLINFINTATARQKMHCRIDPEEFAFILISLGSGILHTWIANGKGYSPMEASRQMFGHIIHQFAENI
ncbi:MAG: TetR/AcrR family transcriptional regulator [Eubacteriales bacterium]|nr:TetR/AcrR family transcriptional regulator [Eubacteriales bacterium]